MKTFKIMPVALGGLVFVLIAASTSAAELEVLRSFKASPVSLRGTLVQDDDGTLYGVSENGPLGGTVFKVTTNGDWSIVAALNVGYDPQAGLVIGSDGNLYGTVYSTGAGTYGAVIKVATNGTWTNLVNFRGTGFQEGANPNTKLVQGHDGNFYGTTLWGGSDNEGTVFKVTTNGTLTTLVSFNGTNGAHPDAGLVEGDDGVFYGTTSSGGNLSLNHESGEGTIFKITAAGVLTTLATFDGTNGSGPDSPLIRGNDGNFYGTAVAGGSANWGTIFRVGPTGGLTVIVSFDSTNGLQPHAELALDNAGNLYGTTHGGGIPGEMTFGGGTVFKVTTNGVLTTLAYFDSTNGPPSGGLLLGSDGYLYGVTESDIVYKVATNGGFSAIFSLKDTNGVTAGVPLTPGANGSFYYPFGNHIFQVATDGVFTPLAIFTNSSPDYPSSELLVGRDGNLYGTIGGSFPEPLNDGEVFEVGTNGAVTILASFNLTNGFDPNGVLVEGDDGVFYGTTSHGGSITNLGTVFKVTTNGVLTTLVSFNGTNGAYPYAGLCRGVDGNFYGTTSAGGSINDGTIFKMTPDGTLTTLVSLGGAFGDSVGPDSELIQGSDGNFYGTTTIGGIDANGTIFKVSPSGTLTTIAYFLGDSNGSHPRGRLHQGWDGNFYGVTSEGGTNNEGTLFQVTTNGVISTLVSLTEATGNLPSAGMVQGADGNFYGFNDRFGPNLAGTFFRMGTAPWLSMRTMQSTNSVVLAGKGLPNESCRIWTATDPTLPFASWTYVGSGALDGTGNFSYTNAMTGTNGSGFYRLSIP